MSNPAHNECVVAAMQEVEAAGFKPHYEVRGKHVAVVWDQAGEQKTYFTSATPSDRRSWLNCRSDIRKILKGAETAVSVPAFVPSLMAHGGDVVASSKDVADAFDKRHDHVLRDIDNLLKKIDSPEIGGSMFRPEMEADGSGIGRRVYHISRDGFALVAMGFTGTKATKFKLAYIQAFNAMERAVAADRERALISSAGQDVRRLEADLVALTDLVLEAGSSRQAPPRRLPFVRPSVLRRQRREARA